MSNPLVVVTAVAPETRAVLAAMQQPVRVPLRGFRAWRSTAGGRTIVLVQGGIGPAAAQAALSAIDSPYDLVLSVGFAGALVVDVAAGDVVLPEAVVWEQGARLERYAVPTGAWHTARAALPPGIAARGLYGSLLSSPVVIASVTAKQDAASRSGAEAVEMEAAALIAVARNRKVGLLALRTILDGADVSLDGLPSNLDSSWRARARLIGSPGAWPRVMALARHIPRATRNLTEATAAVLAAL